MEAFLSGHWLDILTTVLGLIYIWLEYRASIALWVVGVIMPALDIWLYWSHGLYGDAGMAFYYTLAAFYGFYVWKFKKTRKLKQELPIICLSSASGPWHVSTLNSGCSGWLSMSYVVCSMSKRVFLSRQDSTDYMFLLPLLAITSGRR